MRCREVTHSGNPLGDLARSLSGSKLRVMALCLVLVSIPGTTTWAQVAEPSARDPIEPSHIVTQGSKLRVQMSGESREWLSGQYDSVRRDSLILLSQSGARGISFNDISAIESAIQVGTKRGKGIRYGAIAGALAGILGPLAVCRTHCDESGDEPVGRYIIVLAPVGAVFGGLIGASVGSNVPVNEWQPVSNEAKFLVTSDVTSRDQLTTRTGPGWLRYRITPWYGVIPAASTSSSPTGFGIRLQGQFWERAAIEVLGAMSTEYEATWSFMHTNATGTRTVRTLGLHLTFLPIPHDRIRPLIAVGADFVQWNSETTVNEARYVYSDEGFWPFDVQAGLGYALGSRLNLEGRVWLVNHGEAVSDFTIGAQVGLSLGLGGIH